MAAKKGLGRGFEALIPTGLIDDSFNPNTPFDPTAQQDEKVSTLQTLPLASIHPNPGQPRKAFDNEALQELAGSIKEHGVLQPLVVVAHNGSYQIVAGERRYRAAKQAGLAEIPVIIRTLSGQHQLEVSLIENIQRRDLNAIETATAYAKLRDQFNLSNDRIAERVHKSSSAVANTMRLLKLPEAAQVALAEGRIKEGQARPLIGLDANIIAEILPRIIEEEWSARKIEQYMVNLKKQLGGEEGARAQRKADEIALQHEARIEKLRARLAAKVDLRINTKGAGTLVISFKDLAEFERIQSLLEN